mgnify:CR=1 FL=1
MNVLVINTGSSSLKFSLIDLLSEREVFKGLAECLGESAASLSYSLEDGDKQKLSLDGACHDAALAKLVDLLEDFSLKDSIQVVGHRVVHGGPKFSSPVKINDAVLEEIESCTSLAPLHNPANILGIRVSQKSFPNLPQVAVFDTAFASTMAEEVYSYAVPLELRDEHNLRRYGFHGTSHEYLNLELHRQMNWQKADKKRVLTLHLGNGCSLSSSIGGVCQDTTMGLTPLEGLVMGTRSGSLDPGVFMYLNQTLGWDIVKINNVLNKESGLKGLSGGVSDMRQLKSLADEGHERAQLALKVFVHRLVKEAAGAIATVAGVDALVFSGGIGENAAFIREELCERLSYLGLSIDDDKNLAARFGQGGEISKDGTLPILVIPTEEELMIARHSAAVSKKDL